MGKIRFFIVSQDGYTTNEELITVSNHVAGEIVRIFRTDVELMFCTVPQEDWTACDLREVMTDMTEADVVYFCKYDACNKNAEILREIAEEYHLYTLDKIFEN